MPTFAKIPRTNLTKLLDGISRPYYVSLKRENFQIDPRRDELEKDESPSANTRQRKPGFMQMGP